MTTTTTTTIPFVVAIPSYARSTLLVSHTLAYLCDKVPMSSVYVFIVDDDAEICSYKTSLAPFTGINIVCGPIGLHNMRNFITDYFDEGTCVLQMDDDVQDVVQLKVDESIVDPNKGARYGLVTLHSTVPFFLWVNAAFNALKTLNMSLFGVYPVRNGFFMKDLPERTTDLRFCVGVMWGCIIKKCIPRLTLEEKEDFERTILHWSADGGVLRFNHVTVATKYYTTQGGMQARGIDRKVASEHACHDLCERFPDVCRLYLGKKNGMTEVRLINNNTHRTNT